MPKLRHVRVVNAQFNEGKGIYEDFRMPFNGFNATYELVNGGGKSVLLMLLLQCVLPNTALEQKRPFRDMFSGGDENRTTHVLAEWELDDSVAGEKYLLTGFCAKKRSSTDEDAPRSDIKYFNYIHLYSKGNDYDIHRMPLCSWESDEFDVQDYAKTHAMLREKASEYAIRITEKKWEYLEWLKAYYLLESEWGLIKDINKRENHLKTYFGSYKSSRALIEGLLIDTIDVCLRDRQRLNYGGETEASSIESLADALYQSQEALKQLQEEQNHLRDYEKLLSEIGALSGANDRLVRAYQVYEEARDRAASQYKGYEAAVFRKGEEIGEVFEAIRTEEARHTALCCDRERMRLKKFNVRVNLSRNRWEEAKTERDGLERESLNRKHTLAFSRAVNKFLRIKGLEADIREMEARMENTKLAYEEIFNKLNPLGKTLFSYFTSEVARTEGRRQEEEGEVGRLRSEIGEHRESRGKIQYQIGDAQKRAAECRKTVSDLGRREKELSDRDKSFPQVSGSLLLEDHLDATAAHIDEVEQACTLLFAAIDALKDALSVKMKDEDVLKVKIQGEEQMIDRIRHEIALFEEEKRSVLEVVRACGKDGVHSCRDYLQAETNLGRDALTVLKLKLKALHQELETVQKYGFPLSDGFVRALDALKGRYPSVMSGAEYLKGLPEVKAADVLEVAPWLPKAVLLLDQHFKEVVRNPYALPVEVQDSPVILVSFNSLRESRVLSLGDVFIPHRNADHAIDVLTRNRVIERLKTESATVDAEITQREESVTAIAEDLGLVQQFIHRYPDPNEFAKGEELADHARLREEYLQQLKAVAAAIREDKTTLAEKQDDLTEKQRQREVFAKKLDLLKEWLDVTKQKETVGKDLTSELQRERELVDALRKMDAVLSGLNLKESAKSESVMQLSKHLVGLKRELEEYETYAEVRVEPLSGRDIEWVRSEYRAAKGALDETAGGLEELEDGIRRNRVDVAGYKEDIRLMGISLEEIGSADPKQPYSDGYIEQLESGIHDLQEELKGAEGRFTKVYEECYRLHLEFTKMIDDYHLHAPNAYVPDPLLVDASQIEEELAAKEREVATVGYGIEKLKVAGREKEQELVELQDNLTEYRVLDGAHGFANRDVLPAGDLRGHRALREELGSGEKSVRNGKVQVTSAKEACVHNITGIAVAPAFKDTLKLKFRTAETLGEAESAHSDLEKYSASIRSKVEMIGKQIEVFKGIEEKVVKQALGVAMLYQQYLKDFPGMSKIDLDGKDYDMVRINFAQCTYPEAEAEVEMRRYIQDLSRSIESGKIGQDDLVDHLRPKQLVSRVMDMGRVRVKIRKIDRGSRDFQAWDMIKASEGQENAIYIIFFVILMSFIRHIVVSGIYEKTAKVLIVDNPFGSTGAYYLWEPIWSILERNNVQLICSGHKIRSEIREFFPINHLLTEEISTDNTIRINIKVEAVGEAKDALERSQRNTLLAWTDVR
jgi:chromosome segregation ATPase/uncharacterized membrane protein